MYEVETGYQRITTFSKETNDTNPTPRSQNCPWRPIHIQSPLLWLSFYHTLTWMASPQGKNKPKLGKAKAKWKCWCLPCYLSPSPSNCTCLGADKTAAYNSAKAKGGFPAPYMTSEQKRGGRGGGRKYPKLAGKQYRFCGQRGGRGRKKTKIMWTFPKGAIRSHAPHSHELRCRFCVTSRWGGGSESQRSMTLANELSQYIPVPSYRFMSSAVYDDKGAINGDHERQRQYYSGGVAWGDETFDLARCIGRG